MEISGGERETGCTIRATLHAAGVRADIALCPCKAGVTQTHKLSLTCGHAAAIAAQTGVTGVNIHLTLIT